MNFAYITDNNYVVYCGISILSLLYNNKDIDSIIIYILSNDISDENKDKLTSLVEAYGREIVFIEIAKFYEKINFDYSTAGFNSIVLARLFMAEYIPQKVNKIVYLDCDVIVNGDVSELDEYNLEGKYRAAVPELYMPVDKKLSLGLGKDETYYNAGILVINLELWRTHSLHNKFMSFYKEKKGQLPYNDQDIINYCCKGYILPLAQKYNMNPNLPFFPRWFMIRLQPGYKTTTVEEYRDMIDNPCIVHYLGDERPWIRGNHNYYRSLYEKYKALSPWASVPSVKGKEMYMLFYHLLNLMTKIFPWGRVAFSTYIGINIYKWIKKR